MSFLEDVITRKKIEVKERKRIKPLNELISQLYLCNQLPLEEIFPAGSINVIGEVKEKSPSTGILCSPYEPVVLAQRYGPYCRAVSVLTDAAFGGTLDHLRAVSRHVKLPTLRKDFVVDEYQIYESCVFGAHFVLLIARILDEKKLKKFVQLTGTYHMYELVEVRNESEISRTVQAGAEVIGINNRDLESGQVDLATTEKLAPLIPQHLYVISESGIRGRGEIERLRGYVDGFLIGTSILQSGNIEEKLRELTS